MSNFIRKSNSNENFSSSLKEQNVNKKAYEKILDDLIYEDINNS